ncbi:ATP-binding protein [Thioalkalivibrio sp. AKL7]|uniref:ATP-binding protein n=1 Tax=Thioalkalivibrio sp. AKL7 TaxID=1158155 RepID=UPI0003729187|nr:ATP-binding protein [Thioalkalivibrio sp. AKL7]
MNGSIFSGSAEITDEGIKKHFKSYEPIQAIFELIWNGLDAGATDVSVTIAHNDLNGLESITVLDNGDGIDVKRLENNFKKFNESSKRHDDDKHGSHGKGRLAFHRLSEKANWYTRRDGYDAKIAIESNAIKDYAGSYLPHTEQHALLSGRKSGTCVELQNFKQNVLPGQEGLIDKLSKEFGWYLVLNESRNISINGVDVPIPEHHIHKNEFKIDGHNFSATIIRWNDKPSSEKSFNYLISNKNRIVQKELSRFNNKIAFHTSAYVSSAWVDSYDPQALEMDPSKSGATKLYRKVMNRLLDIQREIYSEFLRRHVEGEIERFDELGYFPSYKGLDPHYAEWRKKNTKAVVTDIYIADPSVFKTLNGKQAKIIIRLLDKLLVSNENNELLDVLEGVLNLGSEHVSILADQLQKTTLDNIVSTIETLQKRQSAIHMLREVMENRYQEVLETPDLQKIIERNTWVFGAQYTTLGAEEDSFTKIAKNLRDSIRDINTFDDGDLAEGATVEGVNRQVDLFLARKIPAYDSSGQPHYKCVIVEIKRPGVSLNKKHLRQLDDYAEIIAKHGGFSSQKLCFELILVGRKIAENDFAISQRLDSLKDKAEPGLVSTGRIKSYVKDWFTIFDEFELTNGYLLGTLNYKLEELVGVSTNSLVNDLQEVRD